MNYLTNYYKNLSEQLQEELNNLQSILREAAPPSTSGYDPLRPDGHSDPFLDASDMTPENIAAVAKRYGNTPQVPYNTSHEYREMKHSNQEKNKVRLSDEELRNRRREHEEYMARDQEMKKYADEDLKTRRREKESGYVTPRKLNQYENYINKIDEQINHLTSHLTDVILEYRKTKTQKVRIDDIENDGEEVPLIHGTVVTKRGNPAGKGAAKDRAVAFYPGMGSMPNYSGGGTDEADAEEAIADWGRPTVENNPIYASLKGAGPAQDVRRGELFNPSRFGPDRGHNRPGTGQKAKKKAQAIRSAEYDRQRGRNAN